MQCCRLAIPAISHVTGPQCVQHAMCCLPATPLPALTCHYNVVGEQAVGWARWHHAACKHTIEHSYDKFRPLSRVLSGTDTHPGMRCCREYSSVVAPASPRQMRTWLGVATTSGSLSQPARQSRCTTHNTPTFCSQRLAATKGSARYTHRVTHGPDQSHTGGGA